MINGGSLAGIALFVYWAVAFTKLPFNKLIRDPQWSNWAIRIWAMGLGMVGSYVNLRLTTTGLVSQTEAYTTVLAAAVSTATAIVSFHIGQPGFIDPLDGATTTTVTIAQPPASAPQVSVTETKTPAGIITQSTQSTPQQPPSAGDTSLGLPQNQDAAPLPGPSAE